MKHPPSLEKLPLPCGAGLRPCSRASARRGGILTILTALSAFTLCAQQPGAINLNGQASAGAPNSGQIPGSLAPYLPTPNTVVDQMLQAVDLKPGETLFDLGSGDGRIVIAAARKYKANAIGVELDDELAASSISRIAESNLEKNARISHGDLMQQDYSKADVITVYLWPEANVKVARLLDIQLKKGARVISHDFEMGGWKPTKVITIADDGTGRSHTLFLYIR